MEKTLTTAQNSETLKESDKFDYVCKMKKYKGKLYNYL